MLAELIFRDIEQVTVGALGVAVLALGLLLLRSRTRPVYLLDYFVFRAPDRCENACLHACFVSVVECIEITETLHKKNFLECCVLEYIDILLKEPYRIIVGQMFA